MPVGVVAFTACQKGLGMSIEGVCIVLGVDKSDMVVPDALVDLTALYKPGNQIFAEPCALEEAVEEGKKRRDEI